MLKFRVLDLFYSSYFSLNGENYKILAIVEKRGKGKFRTAIQ
jgi:hypothetical protein